MPTCSASHFWQPSMVVTPAGHLQTKRIPAREGVTWMATMPNCSATAASSATSGAMVCSMKAARSLMWSTSSMKRPLGWARAALRLPPSKVACQAMAGRLRLRWSYRSGLFSAMALPMRSHCWRMPKPSIVWSNTSRVHVVPTLERAFSKMSKFILFQFQ